MARFDASHGIHFYGWMVTELHLKGGDLFAFAVVHQHTQGHSGIYTGNTDYLVKWTGWTEKTARGHLQNLVKRGLIEEVRGRENNSPFCHYVLAADIYEKHPVKITVSPGKNFKSTREKLPHNENIDNKTPNGVCISSPPFPPKKSPAFDFRAAMLAAGVSSEAADAFLQVRKTKRATNTKIAWEAIAAEFSKTSLTPDACIRYAVQKSWAGFKVKWMEEEEKDTRSKPQPKPAAHSRRVNNAIDNMLALGREMFPEGYQTVKIINDLPDEQ